MASTTSKIKMISRIKRGAHAPRFHFLPNFRDLHGRGELHCLHDGRTGEVGKLWVRHEQGPAHNGDRCEKQYFHLFLRFHEPAFRADAGRSGGGLYLHQRRPDGDLPQRLHLRHDLRPVRTHACHEGEFHRAFREHLRQQPQPADADGIRQRAHDQLYIRCAGPCDGSEVSV